ncbi:B12-binding domain-containing radical SAM protein [Nocardia sp. N2S4-5]|uniref:B12-binding domain-containing radical SAM protein n=1 Tax=Nocardia sp. N2S4-5 TaxID=3351565 RepID=UPI0037CE1D92
MARVALVNLASLPMPGNEPIFPIGLRCIQNALDRAGHTTRLIDFVEDPDASADLSWASEPWDVVGFTIRNIDPIDLACGGHVEHYARFVHRVCDATGDRTPLLVGGGPGYSLFADELLRRLGFDAGVVGPGEQVMLDIVADPERYRGKRKNIPGRRYDGFTTELLRHPAALMAAYAATDDPMIGVETRRKTCYQGCVYCPYAYISGDNAGDLKPVDLIAAELQEIYDSGIRRVFFTDGIFNAEIRYAKEVARTIADLRLPGLRWSAYFTPKPFDDEFAQILASSGVDYIVISPDSLDDRMMKTLGKSFDIRHVDRCIDRCRRHGLDLRVNIVFGGPGENVDSVRASAEYANRKLRTGELIMHVGYRVLPETALARQLAMTEDDLLDPTFYPFDENLFSWVVEFLDKRFIPTGVLLNLMAGKTASRRMTKVPVPAGPTNSNVVDLPFLALRNSPRAASQVGGETA